LRLREVGFRACFPPRMPDGNYWACARVHPQREAFAAEHLEARGFEVFLPLVESRRTVAPLLRGYCFVLIVEQWRSIERTFGVLALIRFGEAPARCPNREIEALKAGADDKGIIRLPPPPPKAPRRVFRKGEKVRVIAGGCTFAAIHTGMSHRQRELVLINVLGATRQVEVARHLITAQ
jgi:transcriptional antiterminator RfaH